MQADLVSARDAVGAVAARQFGASRADARFERSRAWWTESIHQSHEASHEARSAEGSIKIQMKRDPRRFAQRDDG
jgi:hypothetical protein